MIVQRNYFTSLTGLNLWLEDRDVSVINVQEVYSGVNERLEYILFYWEK